MLSLLGLKSAGRVERIKSFLLIRKMFNIQISEGWGVGGLVWEGWECVRAAVCESGVL